MQLFVYVKVFNEWIKLSDNSTIDGKSCNEWLKTGQYNNIPNKHIEIIIVDKPMRTVWIHTSQLLVTDKLINAV